jgi:putative FmdB family regulatory protein
MTMPTYEYDCTACGARHEFFQGIREVPKQACPTCGAPKGLQRRIGAGGGLIFRGSGFYITDYRSDSYKSRAKKDAEPATSGGANGKKSGEAAATDAAPAPAPKPKETTNT